MQNPLQIWARRLSRLARACFCGWGTWQAHQSRIPLQAVSSLLCSSCAGGSSSPCRPSSSHPQPPLHLQLPWLRSCLRGRQWALPVPTTQHLTGGLRVWSSCGYAGATSVVTTTIGDGSPSIFHEPTTSVATRDAGDGGPSIFHRPATSVATIDVGDGGPSILRKPTRSHKNVRFHHNYKLFECCVDVGSSDVCATNSKAAKGYLVLLVVLMPAILFRRYSVSHFIHLALLWFPH